jgi:hypothetical protein
LQIFCYIIFMLTDDRLATALVQAREKRGWTQYSATQRMDGVLPNTLRTLEGGNPDRFTDGMDCKLKTVLEIMRVYWPDVMLEHFTDEGQLLRLVPKDAKAERRLKGYLAKTG